MSDPDSSSQTTEFTQFFTELTPERILDSVELLGVRCSGRYLALNSMENRVLQVEIEVEDPDSVTSRFELYRVVKFYRPGRWSEEQIREEHTFLQDLSEQDIAAVAPLAFPGGDTLQKLRGTNIFFAVFPRVGGRNLDELSNQQLERIGRLIARMHNVGASRNASSRLQLNPSTYGRTTLDFLISHDILPPEIRARYGELVNTICDFVEPWFQDASFQRIHGDCHLGNVLWTDQGVCLVDFDDMVLGPPVQDLWLLTPGRDEESLRQRELMLGAYEQMRDFDRESLRLIEPLRALRIIHFNGWIAKRWSDPAFPQVFPEFGSMKYWRDQLQALEEQQQLILRGELY